MAFDAEHIRHLIIRPVLQLLDMHSDSAEALLLGTMAHESLMGKYCRQVKGPALGFWQVEPATEQDNWDNWIKYRPEIKEKLMVLTRFTPEVDELLVSNPYYACAHARIKYYRSPGALPAADDVEGLAAYWKEHYNSVLGAGHPEDWVAHYRKYVKAE